MLDVRKHKEKISEESLFSTSQTEEIETNKKYKIL